ncbi:serine hydrolase domain-containing protein [Sphaerotilus microaerophilus]|jgi:methyl acetate hydrolase|uniref:1,4-butanediol diacrylate esterase n=1 Tax=Sphaerotilus microaerophilus TaxID=2914710 RepID=A0ABN6PM59_9BURK|nr:serine hydrolase domain-containing protein [Sphaerotilus sp. FB-5]BDI05122.1 1,4-butanediol diacrylate esterase [Sphaerotilus sp. FB-5]
MSHSTTRLALDAVLTQTTGRHGGAPGVVAMATDRQGNFYEGAAGTRELGQDRPMTTDSVFAIFSTTKALTGVCAMQLVEEGRLRLDDPAGKYLPEIDELQVLEGFDDAGQPRTRPPKRPITINDLMLHTSGLCYEFFSADDLKYRTARGIPTVVACNFDSIRTVLLHEPGAAWTYGVNIDWLGRIVEQLRGQRLGAVMAERIFGPLDMKDIGFGLTESMRQRRVTIHDRAADGKLTPLPELALPDPPSMDMGGHGLYATVGEYMKFIRMILNDGAGPHGRVLQTETVEAMSRDGLAAMGLSAGAWTTSIPSLSNSGEFFAGTPKGWAYTWMTNRERTPSGRPANALMWAGLANCFYWIDRASGIGGYWATQILPFQDAAAYPGFVEFETAIYHHR